MPSVIPKCTFIIFPLSVYCQITFYYSILIYYTIVSTSCIHDLAAARRIAVEMVLRFGMGEECGLSVPCSEDGSPIGASAAESVGSDIRRIMLEARQMAAAILTEHHETVRRLAEKLLEKKTLNADEIKEFFTSATEKA